MCLLVIIRLVKEVLQVHKTMKQLRLDQYMKRLVREGMIYFFAYVLVSNFLFPPVHHFRADDT